MTSLTGLIGFPTEHSLSPRIHGYWIAQHGIDAEYKLYTTPPARLRQTMLHMRKKNVVGLNITIPHKQSVMEYLDGVDDVARRIGAVNTVINQEGKFIGSNTDAYGFVTNLRDALKSDLSIYLKHIVIIGAGGATRAALLALVDAGAARITLTNRTQENAEILAREFATATAPIAVAPWDSRDDVLRDATLLINTTSLGMVSHHLLHIDVKQLPRDAAVHDIVYAPLETELLKAAAKRGLKTVDGLGMLLYQAQGAFKQWYGITPEVTPALRQHVLDDPS